MGIITPPLKDHVFWMQHALTLAKRADQEGEVPVGAVIVEGDKLIAEGWNKTIQLNDPSAHAEIVALRQAGQIKQNYRLNNLTMLVTLEPCAMCAGALVHSRLKRIIIATKDPRTGCAGSLMNLLQNENLNHQLEIEFGVLQQESSQLISQFFKQKRMSIKKPQNYCSNEA
jgi:tRNA(adenine34) deaminase